MIRLELPEKFTKTYQKKLIKENEKRFEDSLDVLASEVARRKGLRIISLCGPSCSGKTTTAKKIISECAKEGRRVVTVSVDDFYKDRFVYAAECDQRGAEIDFESIDAIDVGYLSICFERMMNGKECMLPVFDFCISERVRYTPYSMKENDVILLEGIQTMYPTIREMIDPYGPLYVFIDAAEELETPFGSFGARDLRLVRRLVRDFYKRSADPEYTFTLWRQVTANEDSSIYPFKDLADFTVSSTMSYEPMIFKKHLLKILGSVNSQSRFAAKAEELRTLYERFPDMDESLLPAKSVFHEFL